MSSSKKKILFLANGFPRYDNPSRCVFNLRAVEQLSEFVEVKVLVIRAWRPFGRLKGAYRYANCNVQNLYLPVVPFAQPRIPLSNTRFMYFLSTIFSLKTVYRQAPKKIDDYWLIHSVSASLPAFIGALWSRRYGVPHVTQLIGSDVNVLLPKIYNMPRIKGWEKKISGVIANSRRLGVTFSKYYPNVRPIRVIYRGTDLDNFNPTGPSYKLKNAYKGVRFLYMGGFPQDTNANKKGGCTLMSAWHRYEKLLIYRDASLLLGGPCTPNSQLLSWRESLIDSNRVHILGVVEPSDVPLVMRAVDAILIPSLNEGMPNVGMEAIACGRPVLGSNVGGMPELVRDGLEGMLVDATDIDVWGKTLIWAASNREALINMGESARHRAIELFDSTSYGKCLYEFYKEIVPM